MASILEGGFLIYVLVGFAAQMVDGTLGMAYGVSSTTFLLSAGIPPALASSSVHVSELFTTFVSGVFHFRFGNVDTALLKRLAIPGAVGGAIGAYVLVSVDGKVIAPFVSAYLLLMGLRILYKAANFQSRPERPFDLRRIPLLAFAGGTLDAIGGGGWGTIVTTTLVSNGHSPRMSIGTVNASEFFVTVAEVIVFVALIKVQSWQVVLGLIIGGMIAAPLAAATTKAMPARRVMTLVGALIVALSAARLVRLV